jgi:5'-3' exonuclease
MNALIDGDILLYRVGYTTEDEPEGIAQFRMEELVNRILEEVKADEYVIYLSDGRLNTFRAKVNPSYKANRTQPKPLHYEFLKTYLQEAWYAEVAVEQEADDLMGINQTEDSIICSIDKDLLQVPGQRKA